MIEKQFLNSLKRPSEDANRKRLVILGQRLQEFQIHLEKDHTVCGRFVDSKLKFLFDNKARWVQSTALVPLGEKGVDGMMAIGSSDPSRFYPGMGTLFLDLLADVISSSLENVDPEARRRSA